MSSFKPGDRVVCVEACEPSLYAGDVLTVSGAQDDFVYFDEYCGGQSGWRTRRFQLAERPFQPPELIYDSGWFGPPDWPEPAKPKPRQWWINVYRNVERLYTTKRGADAGAEQSRLECVHVVEASVLDVITREAKGAMREPSYRLRQESLERIIRLCEVL